MLQPSFVAAASKANLFLHLAPAKSTESFEIELSHYFVDFVWFKNGREYTKKYLIPALRRTKDLNLINASITYSAATSSEAVHTGIPLVIPGVPYAEGVSVTIQVFAKGERRRAFLEGEHINMTIEENRQSFLDIELHYTSIVDADQDGWANARLGGGDCDDSNKDAYPGAREICDGIDTACNGREDEAEHCGSAFSGEAGMILVPTGWYYVGIENSKIAPLSKIYLGGFMMDRAEVSNEDFFNCGACGIPVTSTVGYVTDYAADGSQWGSFPVLNITWNQAVSYCTSLGKRLPTEFEWVAAARGMYPDKRILPVGGAAFDLSFFAFSNQPYNNVGRSGHLFPEPVQSNPDSASPFGVINMIGNAAEWTSSWYDSARFKNLNTGLLRPPSEPVTGTEKIYLGSDWSNTMTKGMIGQRYAASVTYADETIGFRCAKGF